MGIHPIQGFKNMSTGKKIATVASVAVIAATVAAAIKGKAALPDLFQKNGLPENTKLMEGLKELPFKQKVEVIGESLLAGFDKLGSDIKKTPKFAKEVGTKAADVAKGAAKAVKGFASNVIAKFHQG